MILVKQAGEPALQPGQFRIEADSLRVRTHWAQWQAELDVAIEGVIGGKQHWTDLLPRLRIQGKAVVRRVQAELTKALPPLRRMDLSELMATLGEFDGVSGLASGLASSDGMTRRCAAIALKGGRTAEWWPKETLRGAIQKDDAARRGLLQMLFEADRWNRRMAVDLCTTLEIEIGDTLSRQLTAQPPDPRGESAAIVHYLAVRQKDLGALDLIERLADQPRQGEQLSLESLRPYMIEGSGARHDRALAFLTSFLARNRRPYPAGGYDGVRSDEQASAVRAVAASSSAEAGALLWLTAREDPHGNPRSTAWQALIRREGLPACEAILGAAESDDLRRDVFNGVFWDPKPEQREELAGIARTLVGRPLPGAVRKTLTRLVRRVEHSGGLHGQPMAEARMEEIADDPELVAKELVRVGAVTAEVAARALAAARSNIKPDGHVPVLDHCHILSLLDVEAGVSPPWYAQALELLSSNSQGQFHVDAVRQLWFDGRASDAAAVGVIQFICGDSLVEFAVHDRGDYYDMPALLAAANAVLEHLGRRERFHPLGCGDQLMAVAHGTKDAAAGISRLIDLPLVDDADAAMHAGRRGEATAQAGACGSSAD